MKRKPPISLGLILISASFFLERFIGLNDLVRGLILGSGLGMVLTNFIKCKRQLER